MVNQGSLFAFSDGVHIIAQYLGNGGLRVTFASRGEERWMEDVAAKMGG